MLVRDLQGRLAALGFSPGAIDNRHGPKTIAAIKAFQASRGLEPDGVVGRLTLAALGQPLHALTAIPATVSSACVDLIKGYEGIADGDKATVNLEPHVDHLGGVVDIGYGHVITGLDGKAFSIEKLGIPKALELARAELVRLFGAAAITRDQAKSLLAMDINRFAGGVAETLGDAPTSQGEFDALVSIAFNIGLQAFKRSTLLKLHRAGQKVSAEPLDLADLIAGSRAKRQAGTIAQGFAAFSYSRGEWIFGLFRRRVAEALIHRGDTLAKALAVASDPMSAALATAGV